MELYELRRLSISDSSLLAIGLGIPRCERRRPCYVSLSLVSVRMDAYRSAPCRYLVDGNAMFLSATDIVRHRKLRYGSQANCVVVDVGYPLIDSVYSDRRDLDLTPPSFRYTPSNGPDGRPNLRPYSGADSFLDFI